MKKEKIKYSDIIYAFDIETTTTNEITSLYLSNFVSVDFNINHESNEDILQSMSPAYFCRSATEIDSYLRTLNNKGEKEKKRYIIYCHTLA